MKQAGWIFGVGKAIPKVNITAVRSAVLQSCSLQPAEFTRVRRKQQQQRGGTLMMHSHLQAAHVSAALGHVHQNPTQRLYTSEYVRMRQCQLAAPVPTFGLTLSTCFFHANLHPPLFAHCISCCIQLHPINPKIRKAQSDDR